MEILLFVFKLTRPAQVAHLNVKALILPLLQGGGELVRFSRTRHDLERRDAYNITDRKLRLSCARS